MALNGARPEWLTFDCYGTLIQWDEGLLAAVEAILGRQADTTINAEELIAVYDRHEHALEQSVPHRSFYDVAGGALSKAMQELGLAYNPTDIEILTGGISRMPPFPEVVDTLAELKSAGFKLCVISNTDDAIIAGNTAQMGGHIDQVVTAQQAEAYKPNPKIFVHAHKTLGVMQEDIVHICASPHLDLAAARDIGFRSIWINRGTGREPLPDYEPDAELPTLDRVPVLFRDVGWM